MPEKDDDNVDFPKTFFNFGQDMDTESLLKDRMGYIDPGNNCCDCKLFKDRLCHLSNMMKIEVSPAGTCNYFQRSNHVPALEGEVIYEYRNTDSKHPKWIVCTKEWYYECDNVTNCEPRIRPKS